MAIYRSHIALILCAVISLNVLAVPLSYLNFKIHQDYYAKVLCENPEKPITVCGGICYLKKQLPQSTDATPASFTSKLDISVYFQLVDPWSSLVLPIPSAVRPPYRVHSPVAYSSPLFHPPQA